MELAPAEKTDAPSEALSEVLTVRVVANTLQINCRTIDIQIFSIRTDRIHPLHQDYQLLEQRSRLLLVKPH